MAKVVHSLDFSTKDLGNELPRIPVRPPFILVFSPECWHVAAGRLVPQLLTYPAVDGVNQISRDRDGRWVRSKLDASLAESGQKAIPAEWAPDGGYMQKVQTKTQKGQVMDSYISVFSSAYAGDSRIYPDTEAYSEWLAGLVESGKLPKCPVHRVRKMLETAERELLAAQIAGERTPSEANANEQARLKAEVEVLKAELGEQTAKPRKKVKGKVATVDTDEDA